jgi:hypothetical protein
MADIHAKDVKDQEVPRLVHKGAERKRVETTEELQAALKNGWTLHHEPPKVLSDVDITSVPAGTAVAQVAEVTDISQLEAMRNAEVGHPKVPDARAEVVRAIDARLAQLRKGQAVKPPERPPEPEPPVKNKVGP